MRDPAEVITPDESALHPDDDALTSDADSVASSLTSISSSVIHGTIGEGQRTYAVYGKEEYGLPMDEQEMQRMDVCHAKYYALLEKNYFLAPIDENPQRILDLGCGSGIWSIDIADEFPSAEIIGVDIAPTQPQWVPPNCRFELDDIEQPWTWKEGTADFIFARDLLLAIRDFPILINQCYRHLKPGGWVEFQCVTGVLRCDDGSVPKDSNIQKMADNLKLSSDNFGTPIDDPTRWKNWFEEGGFECVTEKVFKMPLSPWPRDKRLKLVGAWEQHNLLNNLDGMLMRLYSKGLGWSEDEIRVFLALVRKDLRNLAIHSYWPFIRKKAALERIEKMSWYIMDRPAIIFGEPFMYA